MVNRSFRTGFQAALFAGLSGSMAIFALLGVRSFLVKSLFLNHNLTWHGVCNYSWQQPAWESLAAPDAVRFSLGSGGARPIR
ncbi:MAG: hypothetical protein PSV22_21555, partial [Pseudolabrys sp.]|nr:hypothetical protein [Pseudolabrys sp.]